MLDEDDLIDAALDMSFEPETEEQSEEQEPQEQESQEPQAPQPVPVSSSTKAPGEALSQGPNPNVLEGANSHLREERDARIKELHQLERQIFDLETHYLESHRQTNILQGFSAKGCDAREGMNVCVCISHLRDRLALSRRLLYLSTQLSTKVGAPDPPVSKREPESDCVTSLAPRASPLVGLLPPSGSTLLCVLDDVAREISS